MSRSRDRWHERWLRLAGREPEAEVDDELAFHLEMRAREQEERGVDPHAARELARQRFGDFDGIRRECRDIVRRRERRMARSEYLTDLFQDLRFTLRSLARRPGFTAVAVLTLALGIGANSAIFSVVDAVLVRPLPYAEPERLVRVYHANPREGVWDGTVSPPDFDDAFTGLERLATIGTFLYQPAQTGVNLGAESPDEDPRRRAGDGGRPRPVNLRDGGEPLRVPATFVSEGFFPALGVAAAHGRTLQPAENVEGSDRALVISHRLWTSRFGADPALVGRSLSLDGEKYRVAGVMPPSFAFPAPEIDLWLPISLIGEDDIPTWRGLRWMQVVARLAPGATAEGARAELDRRLAALASAHPDTNEGWTAAVVEPLHTSLVGEVRPVLRVLFAAVGLVLLIACANLVNLLLARGTARAQELAVRAALGAERRRLVRQLLTEGLVLSLLGAAVGLALAVWGVRLLVALAADHLPRAAEIQPDLRLLGFTLAIAVGSALLFGLLPALRWSRAAGAAALRGEGRSSVGGGERERLRGALVVAEMAFAVLLLVGAGLLLNSLWRLVRVDPGFRSESVLALSITFPDMPSPAELARRRDAVLERVRAVPGVVAAGGSKTLPLHGMGEPYGFALPERPDETITPAGGAFIVTPGYFAALGIPVLRGRDYRADEPTEAPFGIILNAALARQLWGTADAVGKPLRFGEHAMEVIGVVGDVRTAGLGQPADPAMYVGSHMAPRSTMKLFVRTEGDPARLAEPVRRAIHGVEPDLPLSDVMPLEDLVSRTLVRPRVFAALLALFSALALVLTMVGLYGVISFAVAQRTKEIAVRVALGASRGSVLGMVLGRVARLSGIGLALGLLGALALARVLAGQLYGVGARDPATFASVAGALALAAFVAGWVPARRAVRVPPADSLRGE